MRIPYGLGSVHQLVDARRSARGQQLVHGAMLRDGGSSWTARRSGTAAARGRTRGALGRRRQLVDANRCSGPAAPARRRRDARGRRQLLDGATLWDGGSSWTFGVALWAGGGSSWTRFGARGPRRQPVDARRSGTAALVDGAALGAAALVDSGGSSSHVAALGAGTAAARQRKPWRRC
jgi:hypothetical protein